MEYFDIHTHNNEIENGVFAIKNVTLPYFTALSGHENDSFSVGIHPWEVEKSSDGDLELLEKCISDNRVKIIGECGLDKKIATGYNLQLYFFKKQIFLSEKYKRPLIIHCVGYYNELFQLKDEINPTQKWIIHGFRGKPQLARQAVKNGFMLSFGEKHNADSIKSTPFESMLIETDESKKSIKEIYKTISEAKQCNIKILNTGFYTINKLYSFYQQKSNGLQTNKN